MTWFSATLRRLSRARACLVHPRRFLEKPDVEVARVPGKLRGHSDGVKTSTAREAALLLACLRMDGPDKSETALRALLSRPVDWTSFARKVTEHDVAGPTANALLNSAADLLPSD